MKQRPLNGAVRGTGVYFKKLVLQGRNDNLMLFFWGRHFWFYVKEGVFFHP